MINDQIRLYFRWYIKTSFGLSLMLNDSLNESETKLVKLFFCFFRVTNLAFLS